MLSKQHIDRGPALALGNIIRNFLQARQVLFAPEFLIINNTSNLNKKYSQWL